MVKENIRSKRRRNRRRKSSGADFDRAFKPEPDYDMDNLEHVEGGKRKSKAEITRDPLRTGTVSWPPGAIPSVTEGKSPAMDFTAALQRGDPEAQRLLAGAGVTMDNFDEIQTNPPKEEPSLADMFIAETYNMAKRLGLRANQAKRIEPILAEYRNDLRKAHRFVLDKDFVRYATEISSTTRPERMLSRIQYATTPYDVTWIEFDLRTKVEVMRRVHGLDSSNFNWNEVADRLGLIIRRLSTTKMVVEMVCETFGAHGLIGTTICYFYSVAPYDFKPEDGRGTGCIPFIPGRYEPFKGRPVDEFRDLINLGAASLWGYTTDQHTSTVIEKLSQMRSLRLPSNLVHHGVLGTGRMRIILETLIPDAGVYAVENTIANLMLQETTEFTGMIRWVGTVLALINEVPITTQRIAQEGTIRTGLTSRRPLMDYHRITLRVPKLNPIRFLERKLRPGTRHRRHMVRSHWRNYLEENYCNYDQHEWEYDEEHGYRVCGKCWSESTLIPEHERGDASLGWITHEYTIKPPKQE